MKNHVCPWWIAYLLLSPVRRLLEPAREVLDPHVRPGMTVLEVGPGMGYFTLPLARLVGPQGRVVAVDVQPRMLAALTRRARRAGLADRIETRLVAADTLGVADRAGAFDVAFAVHVVHEVPDAARLFTELRAALVRGGRVVFIEPRGHVTSERFEHSLAEAAAAGFTIERGPAGRWRREALLTAV